MTFLSFPIATQISRVRAKNTSYLAHHRIGWPLLNPSTLYVSSNNLDLLYGFISWLSPSSNGCIALMWEVVGSRKSKFIHMNCLKAENPEIRWSKKWGISNSALPYHHLDHLYSYQYVVWSNRLVITPTDWWIPRDGGDMRSPRRRFSNLKIC